jgi:hypothetical protein
MVILQRAWQYATWRRGARLIVDTAEHWQLVARDAARAARGNGQLPPVAPPNGTPAAPKPSPAQPH